MMEECLAIKITIVTLENIYDTLKLKIRCIVV